VLEFVVMSVPLWRPLVFFISCRFLNQYLLELILMESFYIHLETTAIWISIQAAVGLICSH